MANHTHRGFMCGDCDHDSTISTSTPGVELDNFDELLTLLLSVRELLQCPLFPVVFLTGFNILLDWLNSFGRTVPYKPPSSELVAAVKNFIAQVEANKRLFDGIVASTWAGLAKLSQATKDFH